MANGTGKSDTGGRDTERPNVIFIITDQQCSDMMSCAGNPWLKTPAMDYMAENGVRFTRAFCTNPVSSPSRVSLMTGRMPGSFTDRKGKEVRENAGSMRVDSISPEVSATTLGPYLQKSGYDMVYGGKEHLPRPLNAKNQGFTHLSSDVRSSLGEAAGEYISGQHEKPYFMFLSFINPHDICFMAISDALEDEEYKDITRQVNLKAGNAAISMKYLRDAQKIPEGVDTEEFYSRYCPPARPNIEPQKDEPEAIQRLMDKYVFRDFARHKYTDRQWRMHRWAYCRLTEVVDREIRTVLDALKKSGEEENTIVIFTSDHGDMDGAHRLEHKSLPYDEASRIPFIFMWKNRITPRVDSTHLISNGLDLLPTVCDIVGVKGGSDPRGRSILPLVLQKQKTDWRHTLGVESEVGRMVVSDKGYKYIEYDMAKKEIRLQDQNKDPYEMTHVTGKPEYGKIQKELEKEFHEVWFPGK